MALTPSTMLPLGTKAPDFVLPATNGTTVKSSDYAGRSAFLVMFICNHCPFVKHIAGELKHLTDEYQEKGVGVVAINSNDIANYPDDSPEKMAEEVRQRAYNFPYLFDETQDTAKAYRAACTPDFYIFDGEMSLRYRGQMDGSRPNNEIPNDGSDLRAALDAVIVGTFPSEHQQPSIGCNIKWIAGSEPDYFG